MEEEVEVMVDGEEVLVDEEALLAEEHGSQPVSLINDFVLYLSAQIAMCNLHASVCLNWRKNLYWESVK